MLNIKYRKSVKKNLILSLWLSIAGCLLTGGILMVAGPGSHGLYGVYYDNVEWKGMPVLTSFDADFSSNLLTNQRKHFSRNQFSVEWTGSIVIPETSTYTFSTASDDGSWLYIDDTLIVDNGGVHGLEEQSGSLYLSKGTHQITVRYFQVGGYAVLRVFWAQDQESRSSISGDFLCAPWKFRFYQMLRTVLYSLLIVWCTIGTLVGFRKSHITRELSPKMSWLVLLIIFIIASIVRFYNLAEFGLAGDDAVRYASEAHAWASGEYTNYWAKPGYHLLGAVAVKILGYHDYALLWLNALLDFMTLITLFLICQRLHINRFLSLSATGFYAVYSILPMTTELLLPHLPSSTFLLLSFFMLICSLQAKAWKWGYLLLSGLFVTFAGTIHPTLLVNIPFWGLVVTFSQLKLSRTYPKVQPSVFLTCDLRLIFYLGSYAAGCMVTLLGLAMIIAETPAQIVDALFNIFSRWFIHNSAGIGACSEAESIIQRFECALIQFHNQGHFLLFSPLVQRCIYGVLIVFSGWLLVALIVRVSGAIYPRSKKQLPLPKGHEIAWFLVLWGSILWFIGIFTATTGSFLIRLFVPTLPFFLAGTFLTLNIIFKHWRVSYLNGLIFCISIGMAGFYLKAHPENITKPPTIYRQLATQLCGKIDEDNQLLMTPSALNKTVYVETVYIPAQYVAHLREAWEPDLSVLWTHGITFIAVVKQTNASNDEYRLLHEGLHKIDAVLLYENEALTLYQIIFPPDMIEKNERTHTFTLTERSIKYLTEEEYFIHEGIAPLQALINVPFANVHEFLNAVQTERGEGYASKVYKNVILSQLSDPIMPAWRYRRYAITAVDFTCQ